MPFMVQNKTQIVSNTHKYKTIVSKILTWKSYHTHKLICDVLRDVAPFAQFKELEKHTCRSFTLRKVTG